VDAAEKEEIKQLLKWEKITRYFSHFGLC
jgi:hypothetical protein